MQDIYKYIYIKELCNWKESIAPTIWDMKSNHAELLYGLISKDVRKKKEQPFEIFYVWTFPCGTAKWAVLARKLSLSSVVGPIGCK